MKKLLLTGVAALFLWQPGTAATAEGAKNPSDDDYWYASANHLLLPPVEYDHPFAGKVHVLRATEALTAFLCPPPTSGYMRFGCSKRLNEQECFIVIPEDNLLRIVGIFNWKIALSHETAHCNGWSLDHKGARPLSEWKRRPDE
jgi:hypothetical protein